MRAAVFVIVASFISPALTLELTQETWEKAADGKTVFVKFLAPWCSQCKKVKPDWDKLMLEFAGDKKKLVADVDCTTDGGKPLCKEVGVKSYPSIKFGDPHNLQVYTGNRTYDDFKKFADALDFQCGPAHLDRCDEANTKRISELQSMSETSRANLILEQEKQMAKVQDVWQSWFLGFQKEAEEAEKQKNNKLREARNNDQAIAKVEADFEPGLKQRQQAFKENKEKRDTQTAEIYEVMGFIKSVHAHEKKKSNDEL